MNTQDLERQRRDELKQKAREFLRGKTTATQGQIWRHLRVSWILASHVVDDLQAEGVLGPYQRDGHRRVLHAGLEAQDGATAAAGTAG